MGCHRCWFAGLDFCVCGDMPSDLDAPAPEVDEDPDVEVFYAGQEVS